MGNQNKGITHCKRGHEFTPENTRISDGRRVCRTCVKLRMRDWRKVHPKEKKIKGITWTTGAARRYKSEWQCNKLYGIGTLEERDDILHSQGDACDICGITGLTWCRSFTKSWAVDHDHDRPGTHRGILCAHCNLALGKLEPHINAVNAYLAKWKINKIMSF